MSLPRSIDRSDIAGNPVTLTTTTETVVLVGPALQTPKDTSIVVMVAQLQIALGTGATGLTLRVRQGATVGGNQVGASATQTGLVAPGNASIGIMVSAQANFTDYQQWCVTAQQTAASANGTVNGAVALAISF